MLHIQGNNKDPSFDEVLKIIVTKVSNLSSAIRNGRDDVGETIFDVAEILEVFKVFNGIQTELGELSSFLVTKMFPEKQSKLVANERVKNLFWFDVRKLLCFLSSNPENWQVISA